jgi:hypothetical protein
MMYTKTPSITERKSFYVETMPARRPLKIFAFDPMLGRAAGNRITVDVINEPLKPGPQGSRIEVIDYDGTNNCYYSPVDLDDPGILIRGGLDPTESDPRFHQQMVYAVAMKVLENFDIALGRRIRFRRNRRLRIFPHALQEANAYYDPGLLALLFGYFQADKKDPGPNLPGQTVFTCLSHDIIAHEMTHAIVDRLRRYFIEPSNRDVSAFHEGFSDIVAIFQHFSFQNILRERIQETRSDLRSPTPLVELAREFGYATGSGQALRSAIDRPDPKFYEKLTEPHDRGSILVAAVFECFFTTYQRRIKDLIRIATGGTGRLPEGDLHPDLVNRIAAEASRTAQSILTMAIRAFEYLPPVDITFGDYLRALVTADFEISSSDDIGQRAAMIEAFRMRGVYPENVTSLAEESLIWEKADGLRKFPVEKLWKMMLEGAAAFSRWAPPDPETTQSSEDRDREIVAQFAQMGIESENEESEPETDLNSYVAEDLRQYAKENAKELHLDPDRNIHVLGFHPVFRVAPQGQLLVEMVAQFAQQDSTYKEKFGGVPFRGGTTVIASAEGEVRYVISKPLSSDKISKEKKREAERRCDRQRDFVEECDRCDPQLAWSDEKYEKKRIARMMNFSSLHRGISR